jgi:nucleoside-diphosphate-sugar epimerase
MAKENLTILVTGASGFIGSWLVSLLAEQLPQGLIIGTGRRATFPLKLGAPNFQYVPCDLMFFSEMKRRFPARINVVMHLAGDGRTFVTEGEFVQQVQANVLVTANVIDYALSAKTELFMQASSVYVYSGNTSSPFKEDEINIPVENLGATKIAAEALARARSVAGCFRALSFRIFTAYGPRSRESQFIPQAIKKLRLPGKTVQFGPGDVRRDFVYVEDVAAVFLAGLGFLHQPRTYEALNVGSGVPTSIKEVVFLLAELLGVDKRIEFTGQDRAPSRADRDHQADLQRIRSVLNWKPVVPLKEGLRRTIQYHSLAG